MLAFNIAVYTHLTYVYLFIMTCQNDAMEYAERYTQMMNIINIYSRICSAKSYQWFSRIFLVHFFVLTFFFFFWCR